MGTQGAVADATTTEATTRATTQSVNAEGEGFPDDGSVVAKQATPSHASLPADTHGAVIIPAHNEAGVIARTLTALAPLAALEGVEVIVVCNGCQDDTASIARRFAGVTVLETDRGSKPLALNLGDAAAHGWPRLYLDADIDIEPAAVAAVFGALAEPDVLAARARYVYDVGGASWPVRAYYRARSRIPAPPRRLWGAGGYATGEAGHRRFGEFAEVTADDSWFDEQFETAEKRVVPTPPMRVRTPRTASSLLAVLTRQRRGYVEIGIASHASTRSRELLKSVRGPVSAVDAAWYALFTVVSRRRAERARRASEQRWERDGSSRVADGASPAKPDEPSLRREAGEN